VSRSVGLTVAVGRSQSDLERAVAALRARAPYLRGVNIEALRERIVVGRPQECVDRIAAYRAHEVFVTTLLRDDEQMLELLGDEIAPGLRSL
jgi:alkanesulfonate monooxygenase SsuD/methylene tetrahydromethanopterin reductase-like flavin-dependent oxidoreductase (luciferase family)